MTKASDCKCNCGAQAVAFWPCIDPDIRSYPYCRACLDNQKFKALMAISNLRPPKITITGAGILGIESDELAKTDEFKKQVKALSKFEVKE